MIGGDAVAENRERAQAVQVGERGGLLRHAFEVRRILDVGGFFDPRRRDRLRESAARASARRL